MLRPPREAQISDVWLHLQVTEQYSEKSGLNKETPTPFGDTSYRGAQKKRPEWKALTMVRRLTRSR